jgi:hypothetical protein
VVRPVPPHRHAGRGDRLDCRHGIPLDAGNLDQATHRVAREPEVVLDADLGSALDLSRSSPEHLGKACSGHRASGIHLALTPHLGAADGGVLLDDAADAASGQEEADNAV